MSAVVLETKNLSHIYSEGTTSRVDAIRDICLKIDKGELVGVIGHTGSGKSTLIQHFNGLFHALDRDIFPRRNAVQLFENSGKIRGAHIGNIRKLR